MEKRKVGRPEKFAKEDYSTVGWIFQNVLTKRGLQNNTYAFTTMKVINKKVSEEIYEYYVPVNGKIKTSLLAEIGRMHIHNLHIFPEDEVIATTIETAETLYQLHKELGFKVKGLINVCRGIRLNR